MQLTSTMLDALYALPAAVYFTVQKVRELCYRAGAFKGLKAPIPVVSIGNIAMGGTGKTPFTIFLAELALQMGRKPAILSRGYGGSNRGPFLVVSDGRTAEPPIDPAVAGDEPWLMASRLKQVPVIVGRRRIIPARAAADLFGCDMAILDDGFQHMQLHRDLDIVLLNGAEHHMFPLGTLREPLSALRRADIVCFSGEDELPGRRYLADAPIFRYRVAAVRLQIGSDPPAFHDPGALASEEVVLVSGIANPLRFRLTADELGWKVSQQMIFPDHHAYSEGELLGIRKQARGRTMVFTEKDWLKLPKWFVQSADAAVLQVGVVMDDADRFWNKVAQDISRWRTDQ